jgi:hypothetical protein
MPKTISVKGPALLRFPHGGHVNVEARLTMNRSIFSVTGEGEFVTDATTASQALLLDEALSLQIDETVAAHIVVHEARTTGSSARCRFRVQS